VDRDKDLGKDWVDKVISYSQKNRMQTFYNLVLILLIFIMVPGYISVLDCTVVEVDMPPRGKLVVRNDSANRLYYDIWTEHYTNNHEYMVLTTKGEKVPKEVTFSIVDFDYSNIEQKYGEYLKRYKVTKLIKERHLYNDFIKGVKVKMIAQKFDVESIETILYDGGKRAKSEVKGVAHQSYSGVKKDPKVCSYSFGYERIGGKIYGTSLSTDCF
jgi:hypothetical protein